MLVAAVLYVFLEQADGYEQEGHDAEGDTGQQPVHAPHDDEHHEERGSGRQERQQHLQNEVAGASSVVDDALNEVSSAMTRVKPKGQTLQMVEQIRPERVHHPRARPGPDVGPHHPDRRGRKK